MITSADHDDCRYPLTGTPAHIAGELEAIAAQGIAGAALSFINYTDEPPCFISEVPPRLAQAGLRP